MFTRRKIQNPWEGKLQPFKIIGNIYFVGTFQASCHLIDTKDGLILIDPGYANALYLVVRSIYELGFNPKDIKYIINTHWHGDHAEATAAMVDLSGAKTLIGRHDAEKAKRYFAPDILVSEGDTLSLGNTTISFMETPGHTRGTISFFFETEENGQTYRVGMFGGAGANTLAQGRFDYDGCREDYRDSLHRLQKENVDVFIGNHVWNNDTAVKGELLLKTGENKFIDKNLWHEFLTYCEKRLDEVIAKDT
ncbi:MAG: MBL fold metallo-hydrolase [Oscillospiraceae bacterium]|nr:MBL fold metallo-hydrolase [Oscillospiraceae bacterium]